MNSKDLRLIGEAYTNINNSQEQLDEFLGPDAAEVVDKVTKAGQNLLRKAGVKINDTKRGTVTKDEQQKKIDQNKMEDVDFFDTIKGHLMSEGYADTEEAALVIMANMSEEWRQSIIERGEAHYGLVGVPKRPYDAIPGVRGLRTAVSNVSHRMDYPGVKPVKVGDKVVPYYMINPGAYSGALSSGMKPARRVTNLETGDSKSSRQIDKEMTRNDKK